MVAPSETGASDGVVAIDGVVSVELQDGVPIARLASGLKLPVRCQVPLAGVLRLTVGGDRPPGAMLIDGLPDTPARLRSDGTAVAVSGPDVEARLGGPDGTISFGAFASAPAARTMHGDTPLGGMYTADDARPGWVMTAKLTADAAVYGGGENFQTLNLRGRRRDLTNRETWGANGVDLAYNNVPFFWSDAGWGLFIHTGAPVIADVGATNADAATFRFEDDVLDAFIIVGDAPTILRRYLALTGYPADLPGWALGVWMSRCTFRSEREVTRVLAELSAASCPVDVVHVDVWHEGSPGIGGWVHYFRIDRERFPRGWGRRLRDRGVRLSLWHNPNVRAGAPDADHLVAQNMVVPSAHGSPATDFRDRMLVDFTNPQAVHWWQGKIGDVVRQEGVSALKADFGEEVPLDAEFANGRSGHSMRNEYPVHYQRATADALRSQRGEDYALFCRAGSTGSQRYPCHWVGDTPASWDGLVGALRACLSLSMSGFGAVGHDVGGFWSPEGMQAFHAAFEVEAGDAEPLELLPDTDPELYVRWAQWGALSPMMRFHGLGRREPTAYVGATRRAAIDACVRREQLREYLIRTNRQSAQTGTPMMRPMALARPADRGARDADLQYFLGDDILVAPVLAPGGRRRLYVPSGRWRPLWGLDHLEGPGWRDVECGLDAFPAFVASDAPWPLDASRAER